MKIILYYVLATFFLWLAFINVVAIKERYIDKKSGWIKYVAYVFIAAFVVGDAAYNIIFGSLVFWSKPGKSTGGWLFTSRLKYMLKYESISSWRWKLAILYCKWLIEPWDAGHCGAQYQKAMIS